VHSGLASPWAEAVLEAGAALLAGNAVVLATGVPAAGRRFESAAGRAGYPDGLLQVAPDGTTPEALEAACDLLVVTGTAGAKGTMLVLEGAPLDRAVGGALAAAFSRAGRGPSSVGRIVAVRTVADRLLRSLEAATWRLHVGDPRDPQTEVGPLTDAQAKTVDELVREAVDGGAVLVCGGPVSGSVYAPAILRSVPPDARVLHEPVPGPVLAVVEAASEAEAIALARPDSVTGPAPAVSVWSADRAHGEFVARALGAELTWVNEHGLASPAALVRLARYTTAHQLASQPPRLRSTHALPYDETVVRASTATARLLHGRESERMSVLRSNAPALARVATRLARETLGR
jgi:acyl-CoA reductase-like NAD-dependent aldehyde dehydrogenase